MSTEAKMRVYEIAREAGIPSGDLVTKIRAMGLEVKSHQSSLDPDDVERVRRMLAKERGGSAPAESKAPQGHGAPVLRRRSPAKEESAAPAPAVSAVPP